MYFFEKGRGEGTHTHTHLFADSLHEWPQWWEVGQAEAGAQALIQVCHMDGSCPRVCTFFGCFPGTSS